METLAVMSTHYDGAHWGLADWYPEIEQGIVEALARGPEYEWSTGWYSSKKEIASACISCHNGQIDVEVSVSDDFDTDGTGDITIPFTTDLEVIRQAINQAWDDARGNQKDNETVVMFSVHAGSVDGSWIETYLLDRSDWGMEEPPGDFYFEWGWQGDTDEIPQNVRDQLENWINGYSWSEPFSYGGYTVKVCE